MLKSINIENIAVIEKCNIDFCDGFNVLTGETGAGKSIVIDAISAILGERAYRDMIRTGTNKASVRAVFTDVPQFSWFADNGVEYDPETVIQREVYLDGKNVCRVNGTLVTVSILRKLGIQLINIHGQHDSAALFDENNHLSYLDAFADNSQLRNNYTAAFEQVSKLRREIDRITMDEGEKLRRMETLRFQIEEISKAGLVAGEDEELEARRKILQNAEKLSDGINAADMSYHDRRINDAFGSQLIGFNQVIVVAAGCTRDMGCVVVAVIEIDLGTEVLVARAGEEGHAAIIGQHTVAKFCNSRDRHIDQNIIIAMAVCQFH